MHQTHFVDSWTEIKVNLDSNLRLLSGNRGAAGAAVNRTSCMSMVGTGSVLLSWADRDASSFSAIPSPIPYTKSKRPLELHHSAFRWMLSKLRLVKGGQNRLRGAISHLSERENGVCSKVEEQFCRHNVTVHRPVFTDPSYSDLRSVPIAPSICSLDLNDLYRTSHLNEKHTESQASRWGKSSICVAQARLVLEPCVQRVRNCK